ncbi:MAG: 4-alpha-glucanotransferase [Chloroflexi bacterium]|nr:4-alpha-glucanotransferase [Chloroflexota bacterium]
MLVGRSSGILLHPTSLPGPYGVGDIGPQAYRFVDFLAAAGQRLWQVLPLGPTGFGNSPYAASSSFAGNPLLVSLDGLVADGLLSAAEVNPLQDLPVDSADFEAAELFKLTVLRGVGKSFADRATRELLMAYRAFREQEAHWLDDFTLFMALRERYGRSSWQHWPDGVKRRDAAAMEEARRHDRDAIDFHALVQFLFWRQWAALRRYANERGVKLIGDIPIFVALDSADVWTRPDLFWLDAGGSLTFVAGVPPDYFSATGQRWGNPLYRWDVLARQGYGWWIERLRATLRAVDVLRIDHFRGFQGYWEIPAQNETAEHGRWAPGPGREFFDAARSALGDLPIIVEDLGEITPDVVELREYLGYPGMKVLQFAFDSGPANPFLPHNFSPNCVVYTGTHDNDTTVGWFESQGESTRSYACAYLGVDGFDISWDLIRLALASVAEMAIVPLQDVLSLGTEARMNFPGRAEGNWAWRFRSDQLTADHAARLRRLTETYGRVPASRP